MDIITVITSCYVTNKYCNYVFISYINTDIRRHTFSGIWTAFKYSSYITDMYSINVTNGMVTHLDGQRNVFYFITLKRLI